MWKWLNVTLQGFNHCFRDKRSFNWFVIIVIGLMIRSDNVGLTSIVRELNLIPSSYIAILHFFKAESWSVTRLQYAWQRYISNHPLLYRLDDGRPVMIGDGVKQSKEGRYMPGVKRLHQESENSSKGEFIFGHMFGGLGVLLGGVSGKLYCVLISLRLHDGLDAIREWFHGETRNEDSHVVKMIKDAAVATRVLGASLLLLDRLYLTVPMLTTLFMFPELHVVTKAKSNATAYYDPKPKTGRGAKPKKGKKVSVSSLFATEAKAFRTFTATLYGKEKQVSYYCIDLLWGLKWYQKLRFVLVVLDGKQAILASTDLTLPPEQIIMLYCHRFKIECSFRELKQVVSGFGYRFWSKSMPKLNKYAKNEASQDKLRKIKDTKAQTNIESTVDAIERFTLLGCIALGLLQIISISFAGSFKDSTIRFMRTKSNAIPSEATVADYMRKNIYQLFRFFPYLAITLIISDKQFSVYDDADVAA